MSLHGFELFRQCQTECLCVGKAEKAGDVRNFFRRFGHRMRLLVLDHLQPMFERPQKAIGILHVERGFFRHQLARAKCVQRRDSAALAQHRHAPAQNQLLGLGEELDLADAAASELYVVTRDRDGAMALMRMNLALDGVNVFDRGIVEIAAPDKGHDCSQKILARLRIAGAGAGLDECRTFPVLTHTFVIRLRSIDGDGNLCRAGIGPQPQVDAKDVAVRRDLGQ